MCLISSDTSGPGRLWDPEEVLPAYEQLRSLIDKWQPVGKNIDIIDGEHGFYTACASTAAVATAGRGQAPPLTTTSAHSCAVAA